MSPGLFIAGGILVLVAGASIVLLRRHEGVARRELAARLGWSSPPGAAEDIFDEMRGLTLFELGHSRRVDGVFQSGRELQLFQYICETGFENRRRTHRWVVAALSLPHTSGVAVISREDWLLAASSLPGRRRLPLHPHDQGGSSLCTIVDDADTWQGRLSGELGRWLAKQPIGRSWEVLPGFAVVYDPGVMSEAKLSGLADSVREFSAFFNERDPANQVPAQVS